MSFILDAIAKSERERQQQEIPDARVLATPLGEIRQSRRTRPYLLGGALLLVTVAVIAWIRTDWSPFGQSALPDPGATAPSATHSTIPDIASRAAGSPAAPTDLAAVSGRAGEVGRTATRSAPTGAGSIKPRPMTSTETGGEALTDGGGDKAAPLAERDNGLDSKTAPASAPPVVENGGAEIAHTVRIEPHAVQHDAIEPVESREPASTRNDATPRVSRLGELPADVRRALPSVSFTGHLYSKKARSSYVLVDGGRTVVAGQRIVDDLFLHEITPTGVVVEFRGFLIEVGILQNWSLN